MVWKTIGALVGTSAVITGIFALLSSRMTLGYGRRKDRYLLLLPRLEQLRNQIEPLNYLDMSAIHWKVNPPNQEDATKFLIAQLTETQEAYKEAKRLYSTNLFLFSWAQRLRMKRLHSLAWKAQLQYIEMCDRLEQQIKQDTIRGYPPNFYKTCLKKLTREVLYIQNLRSMVESNFSSLNL